MTKTFRIAAALLAAVAAGALPAISAQAAGVYTGIFGSTALSGYDAVSYFSGRPVEGVKQFSTTYKGATFRFASAANLAKFKANPAAFAPQYGGHCAWAVSQGYLFAASPKHWKVVGGKLYLNYNGDVQSKWVKNIPGHIASANKKWPTL